MKAALVFLAGVVVGGLTVRFIIPASRAAGVGEVETVDSTTEHVMGLGADVAVEWPGDGERSVLNGAAQEPGGTADEKLAAERVSGLPGDLEGLSAELQRLLGSNDEPWWKIKPVLEALARLDDPGGLECVLDCMREDCLGHGAAPYAEILAGLHDARIFEAANDALEANLAVMNDSWFHTDGYLDLIAAQGGPAAAAILLSYLGSGGQLGHGAANAVTLLGDPDLARAFLERIRTGDAFIAWALAKALASWGDAGIISDLFDIGFGGATEAERRRSVLNGTAEGMPRKFAAQFVARIEVEPGVDARIAGLSALGYLAPKSLGSVALPAILGALGSPSQAIAAAVLPTVNNHDVLHTASVESLLAAWLPIITDPGLRNDVTRTLVRVRNR